MDLNRMTRAARYAVIVACDVVQDVAAGVSQTTIAAAQTLSLAVMQNPAVRLDPEPWRPSGIPAAPPPFPPLPKRLMRDLGWPDMDDPPAWVPDDLAGLDKRGDGPELPS